MTLPAPLTQGATALLDACRAQNLTLGLAESCTGGLIAATITAVPGSSDVLDRGFVTYANQAKVDMLGVKQGTLDAHGAVSEQTAGEMVAGVLANAPVDVAGAVTGIAGPGGGSDDKPVGLVYLAVERKGHTARIERRVFDGDRDSVREQAALTLLKMLTKAAQS